MTDRRCVTCGKQAEKASPASGSFDTCEVEMQYVQAQLTMLGSKGTQYSYLHYILSFYAGSMHYDSLFR